MSELAQNMIGYGVVFLLATWGFAGICWGIAQLLDVYWGYCKNDKPDGESSMP